MFPVAFRSRSVPVVLGMLALVVLTGRASGAEAEPDWVSLFDGRSLAGWKANESPGSHRVEGGAIVCQGARSHLFYVGPTGHAAFTNFVFEAEVMTEPGANSGIYFHTRFQDKDWLKHGYEVQVNNTATGEGGYRENKKTGSLYGVRNVYRQLVPDREWLRLRIEVRGFDVAVFVNDVQTVRYAEPANAPTGGHDGRRLGSGTFALQAHDPGSRASFRQLRIRPLPELPDARSTRDVISPALAQLHADNFPVVDLHTHLKGGLTLADVLDRQYRSGINAGIALNCGLGFAITNDAGIHAALPKLRHPLTWVAMQAEGREWTRMFSPQAIAQFDYVFTDAMTVVDDAGRRMRLWIPDEVTIGDPEAFMDMLVDRTEKILSNEPVDVWVNPTYLPAPLDREYDRHWTVVRMDRVIAAAVKHGVAIEINDRFRLPSAAFLKRAKAAGAKFTFGTNNGGPEDLRQLEHAVARVKECGLQWQDFWMPGVGPNRATRDAARR